MIPFFPHQIANRALLVYGVAVTLVTMVFYSYSMPIMYLVLGVIFVTGFFVLTSKWSIKWGQLSEKQFIQMLFGMAIGLRLIWVVASYYYYIETTGNPFDKDAMDARGYHYEARWLAGEPWSIEFG